MRTGRFSYKSGLLSNEVCHKVSWCETVGSIVVRHALAYLIVHKCLMEDVPFYLKFWEKLTPSIFRFFVFKYVLFFFFCVCFPRAFVSGS